MNEFFVFKAGKYPQGDWPVERVKNFVDAYDPENGIEAPLVIGHRNFAMRDADQFAHGWVRSLRMDKDGKVYATISDCSLEARHAIAEKKLRYISVEIYENDKVNKDEPPYLKAVAMLGRDNPAVVGTKIPAMFNSIFSGGVVNTTDEENNISTFTRKVSAEEAKTLFAVSEKENKQEEAEMKKTAEELLVELEQSNTRIAELEKSAGKLAAFQKENEELKAAGKKQDAEAYFGKLRDEGKLSPAIFDRAVALDVRLGDDDRKEIRAMFAELDTKVDLSGKHKADKKTAPAPAAGSPELTAKIRAFQKERNMDSFSDAASALFAEKPELFNEEGSND